MYGFFSIGVVTWLEKRPKGLCELDQIVAACQQAGFTAITKHPSFHKHYSLEETTAFLEQTAQITGIDLQTILEQIGDLHLTTLVGKGYMPLLRALGSNMFEVIQQLDSFHMTLAKAYPKMRAPSFRPVRTGPTTCEIHYYSVNHGFAPFAMALLRSVARILFKHEIQLSRLAERGVHADHDIFLMEMEEKHYGQSANEQQSLSMRRSDQKSMAMLTLLPVEVDALMPWHIMFNRDLVVKSVGSSLVRRFTREDVTGCKIYQLIRVLRPTAINAFSFSDYLAANRKDFVFKVLRDSQGRGSANKDTADDVVEDTSLLSTADDADSLYLKGEVLYLESQDAMLFVGTPLLTSVEMMDTLQIKMVDLPISSNARDLLIGVTSQSAIMLEAENLSSEAAKLNENLAAEKRKAEELLHRILPPVIARKLAMGENAPAETHSAVSVLFSDIVGFTTISSSVHPEFVMAMLNELFSKFDALCDVHKVYKVETIGDAYMVVCGMPEPNPKHADCIAAFAVDMIEAASTVMSPINNKPLQIRVGIHTGSIMAGVVGKLRPRFCLFGDTVNTASRMESTSQPGRVQISTALYQALNNPRAFHLELRGPIEVKGKGSLTTWWLSSTDSKRRVRLSSKLLEIKPARGEGQGQAEDASMPVIEESSEAGSSDDESHDDAGIDVTSAFSGAATPDIRDRPVSPGPRALPRPPSQMRCPFSAMRSSQQMATQDAQQHSRGPVLLDAASQTPQIFDVDVCRGKQVTSLSFVSGQTTMQDLVATVVPDAGESDRWRLCADKEQSKVLVSSMTVANLHRALVLSRWMRPSDDKLTVYLCALPPAEEVF